MNQICLSLSLFLVSCLPVYAAAPDIVFVNGKIVTVDDDFSIAEAFAIEDDRIVGVGSNADILKLKTETSKVVDLQGRTVLPGLIDSHVHPTGASMFEFDHPVPVMETMDDVLQYIRERTQVVEKGKWISLSQVFITRLREQRYPTRAELDEAAPDHPVYFRTGPDAALNSLALAANKIDKEFKVPEGNGAIVERDESGEPTGVIRKAGSLVKRGETGEKKPTDIDRKNRLKELLADYNKVGLTSISDRNTSASGMGLYQELKGAGELTCRVYAYRAFSASGTSESIADRMKRLADDPLHAYNNMLWSRGIKLFLDGGMLTGSAYMREPWGVSEIYSITDPNYRGTKYIEADRLYEIAKLALENDLQITAHSVGDGAVHALVDAYERVNSDDFPVRDGRPCITHCNFMSADAIDRMAKIGIVADLQPAWLLLDGATLQKQFGDKRTEYFQPYQTLFQKNVVVGGGSDHMQKIGGLRSVNPYNPFLGMWITLTRQPRWTDQPLHPEQRINREQAIRLYTINNAYLTFEEKEKGSLESGKLADFIILKQDILECRVEEIKEIEVKETWLGGKRVY
ncbi:amidohydrolase [Thalassoglobus polymorphus]|uniref:N-substituted formamide deformylase n=1 Tax=Thalassoglobus polymorphus TaxID=2527994 RepID=A0A517QTY9_9PLAN|nr:amidohydrolase [Thalassoglobus polymorphus]QDT35101.1 N-substituted formamide deformylase precursor [Thalassoglobus polymorphus]